MEKKIKRDIGFHFYYFSKDNTVEIRIGGHFPTIKTYSNIHTDDDIANAVKDFVNSMEN